MTIDWTNVRISEDTRQAVLAVQGHLSRAVGEGYLSLPVSDRFGVTPDQAIRHLCRLYQRHRERRVKARKRKLTKRARQAAEGG